MMHKPLISIVMPVRNAERFIAAALNSLLIQESVSLEILVVDDGSTDCSMDVVRQINDRRIRIIPSSGSGIAATFNTGLNAAHGQFIARCDADDLYASGRLESQLNLLNTRPTFGAVCGGFATVTSRANLVTNLNTTYGAEEITNELRQGVVRTHFNSYLIRTEVLRQLGGCRSFFVTGEDIDLQLRLAEVTQIWFDPSVWYYYRLHDSSVTHQIAKARQMFYENAAYQFQMQRRARGSDDLDCGHVPEPPVNDDSSAHSAAAHVQQMLLGRAWRQHIAGRKYQSIRTGLRAAMARPQTLRIWRDVLVLAVTPTRGRALPSETDRYV